MTSRNVLTTTLLTTILALGATAAAAEIGPDPGVPLPAQEAKAPRPVDLALCLDTSGSMENLIESAKQHLWSLVNDLALARPQPRLRVALLTYGNTGHPAE